MPEITIAFWNLFIGESIATRAIDADSQRPRITELTNTINTVKPDVVFVAELHKDNVEFFLNSLNNPHDYSKSQTYVDESYKMTMLMSSKTPLVNTEIIDFDHHNRKSILTETSGVQVVGTHLSHQLLKADVRIQQVESILENIDSNKPSVIVGDFNCFPNHRPRKRITRRGYSSVAQYLGNPKTFPMGDYRKDLRWWERLTTDIIPFELDDIYVKGLEIIEAGVMDGPSDHRGLWARLRTTEV